MTPLTTGMTAHDLHDWLLPLLRRARPLVTHSLESLYKATKVQLKQFYAWKA